MESRITDRPVEREIDLAGRPTRRVTLLARLFVRLFQISFWLAVTLGALPLFFVARRNLRGALGAAVTFLFQRLGATFIKIGQIMSTRPDIFSPDFIAPLVGLQDRVPPFSFHHVRRAIEQDFARKLEDIFVEFDQRPVASASVAQVHRAVLREEELPLAFQSAEVAVKVRRPNIVSRAYLDQAILELGARVLSLLPSFSLISPAEAVAQFCAAVQKQLDFRIEAENNRRFQQNFANDPHIVIPSLVDQLCGDRVLVMEFIHGFKDDKIRASGNDPAFIARKGTEAIVRMIFQHGFVHADLHPGNLLFLPGNRIAAFDLGLVGELSENDRRRYAFLCYYIVSGMGADVARMLADRSPYKPRDYVAFERDVVEAVSKFYDRPFEEVQLTGLIAAIYGVARRHRVRFEATFTVANIAMMVIEGIGRQIDPKLNVTREARPYLESALALAVSGPSAADAPSETPSSVPSSVAQGRYRVRRLIGEGVRKRVYLARDTRLDREVALAFIRTEGLDETVRARVLVEARAVAKLADHPRIVPVHDAGEEDGVPFLVSQYMAGGTLSGRLLRATEHRIPLDQALRFADQICQALEHAHAHGIIHRDVKPENVWLTEDGFAKLGDFGLARTLGRPDGSLDGMTVGTALYMPPEQALGRAVDQRSDLYSFGATLYELLTGRPPFEGDSVAEVISRHINANPEPPSRRNPLVPLALDGIVLRLLAKDPGNRFESAAAVRKALADLAATASTTPKGSSVEPRGAPEAPSPDSTTFVGREQEMGRLRKALEQALAGRGRLVLLVGEPGIGKTRTATQLASYASTRGVPVLVGRCHEGEGAPAFWPWVQILRSCLEERDPARIEAELGAGAPFVAQVVPQIRELLPELPPAPALDGEAARFRLFDAVAGFLGRLSESRALVILLDDLHWADKPSLLLLQFVAQQMAGARILIIGTYRDVDVQHGHPLAEVLPSLRREHVFERLLLRGLPEEEVRALVTSIAGEEVPEPFVEAISRETEGNPFFIEETLRHLVEERIVTRERGRWTSRTTVEEMGLPEGVREVIGRRLARLSADCRNLLTIASALGRDFDSRVLPSLAGIDPNAASALLEEAIAARIVEEDKVRFGHYRFSHALIRETLYGELGSGERVQLHRKIATALEALHAGQTDAHLSELAHHFFEAALGGGDVDRAIRYGQLGAERAARRLAYEEAATLYQRALRAIDLEARPDERRRCEILLGLGEVQWDAGDYARSKATLRQTIDLAARLGAPEHLARATLSHSGRDFENTVGQVDRVQIELLDKAIAGFPKGDSGLRALLLARLASTLAFSDRRAEIPALAADARSIARRLGDKAVLASVLTMTAWAEWGPDNVEQNLAEVEEVVHLAEELHDERLGQLARGIRVTLYMERGLEREAEEALAEFERARGAQSAWGLWYTEAILAGSATGRLPTSQAEALVQRAFKAARSENRPGLYTFAFQRTVLLWQRGELEASEQFLQEFVTRLTDVVHPGYHAVSALLYAEFGSKAEAQKRVDRLAANGFRDLPRDFMWCGCLTIVGFVVASIGDVRSAAKLYEILQPYAGRIAFVLNCFVGTTSLVLGILANVLSRFDEAEHHFETALERHRRLPVWLARTQYEYGRFLLQRAREGDRAKAISLLASAVDGARAMEMKKVAEQALALKLHAQGVSEARTGSSIDAVTASIEAKGIDVRRATAPNGTVTLLFSDMEGFTEMTERLGDAKAHQVMQAHHRIIRQELRTFGASEIEEQGDGFLLAFPKASEALRYAVSVQRALAAYRAEHPEQPIRVRMGLHTGEPIKEGDRFFGKTVILASRISAFAKGDEILVSGVVRELVKPAGGFTFDDGEDVTLKGLAGTHRVYATVWDPSVPPRRPSATTASPTAEIDADGYLFRREGDFWTLRYAGRSVRLKDAKGLQYMAELLRRQGEEIHVTDLVNGAHGDVASAGLAAEGGLAIAADLGDAGEILDAKARGDYRERLEDLRAALGEAQAMNDTGRVERLHQEIDFITQELSSAFGLGGRGRKSAAPTERARKAVSGRISDSISRIRKENAELGTHLANSIRLGVFCAYAPEKPVPWTL